MLHKGFIESQSDYGTVTPSHKSGTNTLRKGPCARNSDTLILNVSKTKKSLILRKNVLSMLGTAAIVRPSNLSKSNFAFVRNLPKTTIF